MTVAARAINDDNRPHMLRQFSPAAGQVGRDPFYLCNFHFIIPSPLLLCW